MHSRLPALLACLTTSLACQSPDPSTDDEAGDSESTTDSTTDSTSDESDESETSPAPDMLDEPEPLVEWPLLDCDPLVPEYCTYPFPNNAFTVADPGTATGRRVEFTSTNLPTQDRNGTIVDPTPFNRADGFSPGQALLTFLPGATVTGLPSWTDLEASLADDCPTVLLDAETGERIPHYAELDMSLGPPDQRSFMIRPVVRLDDSRRYIMAIRNVVDDNGQAIAPSPGFRALRDLEPSDDPAIESRRPLYADIFARLEDAGVERGTLQIAWDYTTASEDFITRDLLSMRDQANAFYAEGEGPSYVIDEVDTLSYPDEIAYRLVGRIEVPLFLDDPGAGGRIVRDADGLPEIQGTAEYGFIIMIPHSATMTPGRPLQHGHGLLGSASQVQGGERRKFANDYNYVNFALDWVGMANDDTGYIIQVLGQGQLHDFDAVPDRLRQGLVNFELGMRMMKTSFAADPDYGQYVDPSEGHYLGISQGGIFGGTYMAIATHVERGVLDVPGQPYNLLLNRSVDFDVYLSLLLAGYDDSRDIQVALALAQMLWDHAEPNGYTRRITNDPFPGTPVHDVLIRAAVGDHQVTNLGAHIMARAVGAPHLDSGVREIWGLDVATGSNEGSTYVEYDFGLPMDPIENVPQEACDDPHGKIDDLAHANEQAAQFFATGVVENLCPGGVCSTPELSGCP
jgi:hypothetical protein